MFRKHVRNFQLT